MDFPIYLDHAATTPAADEVVSAMLPYFSQFYGNASAIHSLGAAARDAVESAREAVAQGLNASAEEIVFTSGGTESDNAALKGAAAARGATCRHLLSTAIEHHAVLETLERLAEEEGFTLEMVPVDRDGRVDPANVAARIRPHTALVSIMHANNEIGTIQPIAEIGAICRERGVLFHTDAVQTAGKVPIDVRAMSIDLLSISAHKLYGPKGIGALYIRRGVQIERYQDGGEQERGRRGGTLNVPGIVGLGKAMELAQAEIGTEGERQAALRDWLMEALQSRIEGVTIVGSRRHRLPMNVHICIEGVQGEPVLLALDAAGVCASAGSACTAGSPDPSHVLKAIGIQRDMARGALRLTLGKSTCREALDYTVDVLVDAVRDLRRLGAAA
jgi:cysteine desulfurase